MFNIKDFVGKAKNLKLPLPELWLGVINKSRTFDKKVTKAYKAHVEQIEKCFKETGKPVPVVNVKDCNNISLVVNYTGTPISRLENKKYMVYDNDTQVNESQLAPILNDVYELIGKL